MNLVSLPILIVPQPAGDCNRTVGSIVGVEEGLSIATGNDPGALVVQQGCGVTLEYADGMAETL